RQPAAVDMAEQIILGAGVGVEVRKIDTGPVGRSRSAASGFYRHPHMLPDASGRANIWWSDRETDVRGVSGNPGNRSPRPRRVASRPGPPTSARWATRATQ